MEDVNPENLYTHFSPTRALIEKHKIADPTSILNLDEAVFSIRGMTLVSTTFVAKKGTRGNIRESNFRRTCDTLMPVVSAAGQIFTAHIVLPGKKPRFRKLGTDWFETCTDFLPQANYLFMRAVAGVDIDVFFSNAHIFNEETTYLRRGDQKSLFIMDIHVFHASFNTLSLFKCNGIVAAGLPPQKSHVLQPLDVNVFEPHKEEVLRLFSHQTVVSNKEKRNYILTIFKFLCSTYQK